MGVSRPSPRFDPASAPYSYQEKVIPRQRRALPIFLLLLALLVLLAVSVFWFVIPRSSGKVSPSPTSTVAGQVYPNVAGAYQGTIMNTTANIKTSMALSIQQNKSAINGNFTVSAPLSGSNPFQGQVDSNNHIQFMVQGYNGNAPLFFTGTVHADGSLSGTYCSLGANGQCSTGAGASGTWQVNRGEGNTSQSFGENGKTNINARNKRNKH